MIDEKRKGGCVLDRRNPPAEPTRISADWTDTFRLYRDEIRNEGGAKSQEKMCLASRGNVKSKGWTLLA